MNCQSSALCVVSSYSTTLFNTWFMDFFLTSSGPCTVSLYLLIYFQHDTVYLFLENCSICFGWYLHPSSGARTTVQYLVLVKALLLSAAIVEELELV